MRRASGIPNAALLPCARTWGATMHSTSSQVDATAKQGLVVLTSRVSVEMVQKSAAIGAPIIAAVSAPTALAVRMANSCGMTLVAIARKDGFEVFTHPRRVSGDLVIPAQAELS